VAVYGLVNKAIEDLAVSLGGVPLWLDIARRADIDVLTFVSLDDYDDQVTYRLVDAASAVLGLSPQEVLEAFGEHWVRFTGREGYGSLMSAYGDDVASFLRNLDALHERVRLVMPQLRPPSFTVEDLGPGRFQVHYRSERTGLGPMVTGLLRGVGALFDTPLVVERITRAEDGADHDVFDVTVSADRPGSADVPVAADVSATA
jgi:hypothetical protein